MSDILILYSFCKHIFVLKVLQSLFKISDTKENPEEHQSLYSTIMGFLSTMIRGLSNSFSF